MSDPVVILSFARTPMGAMLGELAGFSANELGALAIKGAVAEAGIKGECVCERCGVGWGRGEDEVARRGVR